MKRFFTTFFITIILLISATGNATAINISAGTKLYFQPNSNWTQAGAWFAVYFYGNGNNWAKAQLINDSKKIYEITVPSPGNFTHIIILRKNPSNNGLNWDDEWNRIPDAPLESGKNFYTMNNGTWGGNQGEFGSWSTKTTSNNHYYQGTLNSWGCKELTPHKSGKYSYYYASGSNDFKLSYFHNGYDYGWGDSHYHSGFMGTNITLTSAGSDNNVHMSQAGYIMVFYPNTTDNPNNYPKFCANTTLLYGCNYDISGTETYNIKVGNSQTFDVAITGGASPAYSWSCENAEGMAMLTNTSSTTPTFTPTKAGVYPFKLTVTEDGCETIKPVTVTVTCDINISGTGTYNISKGESQQFNMTISGVSIMAATKTWSCSPSSGMAMLTDANTVAPTFTPTAVGTYIFTLTVKNGGCEETKTVTVNVSENCDLNISGTANYPALKVGNSQPFTMTVTGASAAAATYSWSCTPSSGLAMLSSTTTANPTFTPTTPGNYTFTFTATNGECTKVAEVTASVSCDLNISGTTDYPTLKIGNSQPFTMTVTGVSAAAATYSWTCEPSSGLAMLSSTTTANPIFTPTAPNDYTFTFTATNGGCEETKTITANVSCEINISGTAEYTLNVGTPQEFEMAVTGASVSPSATYAWTCTPSSGEALLSSTTVLNPTLTPTERGTYTYTLTVTNGVCETTQTVTVTIKQPITIYYYNNMNWSTPHLYAWRSNYIDKAWPGTSMTAVAGRQGWYSCNLSDMPTTVQFNIGNNTDQTANITMDARSGYVYYDSGWYDSFCAAPNGKPKITGSTTYSVKQDESVVLSLSGEADATWIWTATNEDFLNYLSATDVANPTFDAANVPTGTYNFTVNTTKWDCEVTKDITVTVTAPQTYHIKHPFDGGDHWYWREMTRYDVKKYELVHRWQGAGANWNTEVNDGTSTYVNPIPVVGDATVQEGQKVRYILDATTTPISLSMEPFFTIDTKETSNQRAHTITLYGNVAGPTTGMTSYGIEIADDNAFTTNRIEMVAGETSYEGKFSVDATDLESSKHYYRAFAVVDDATIYGETKEFTLTSTHYYIAGNGSGKPYWVCGYDWNPKDCPLSDDGEIIFELPNGNDYQFKISLDGTWDHVLGYNDVDHENSTIELKDVGGYDHNVGFNLGEPKDIKIAVVNNKIVVTYITSIGYRIKSETNDYNYYSNVVKNAGDIMSVYAEKGGTLTLQKNSASDVNNFADLAQVTSPDSMVIVAPLVIIDNVASIGTISEYNGLFYLRSDLAAGGWTEYTENEGNYFTYFEPNVHYPNETFNHYWVKYVTPANAKAQVANDYNVQITKGISDYHLPANANLRYSYSSKSNAFNFECMKGSTEEDDNYLQIAGTNIFSDAAGENAITRARFTDISDFVYEIDLYAKPGATIEIYRNHASNEKCLSGSEPILLLGAATTANNTYQMRVTYDYKRNRIVGSWIINEDIEDLNEELTVDANMMFVRKGNEDVTCITMTNNGQIADVNRIYFVIELNKTEVIDNGTKLYWFSLPFDCNIADIFGIGGYGSKWVIQRYRGDKRAENGFKDYTTTFWANMKNKQGVVLEKNRGYALSLNLTESDFKAIEDKSILRLYFPTNTEGFVVKNTAENMITEVPEHKCTIAGRDSLDSHWNVIGIPSYQRLNMEDYAEQYHQFVGSQQNTAPSFLYAWDKTTGYTVQSGTEMTYNHFGAYMVQFAGTINWGQYTVSDRMSAPGIRRAPQKDAPRHYALTIASTDNALTDKTFVTLSSEGSDAYVINRDLEKLVNATNVNIYSVENANRLAANDINSSRSSVAIGIIAPEAGEYTIGLKGGIYDKDAILHDRLTGIYTDLSLRDYSFTAIKGTENDRFELLFAAPSDPTTDFIVPNENRYLVTTNRYTINIDGLTGTEQVRLYDAVGRVIEQVKGNQHLTIQAPTVGVYMLQIGNETHKILIGK